MTFRYHRGAGARTAEALLAGRACVLPASAACGTAASALRGTKQQPPHRRDRTVTFRRRGASRCARWCGRGTPAAPGNGAARAEAPALPHGPTVLTAMTPFADQAGAFSEPRGGAAGGAGMPTAPARGIASAPGASVQTELEDSARERRPRCSAREARDAVLASWGTHDSHVPEEAWRDPVPPLRGQPVDRGPRCHGTRGRVAHRGAGRDARCPRTCPVPSALRHTGCKDGGRVATCARGRAVCSRGATPGRAPTGTFREWAARENPPRGGNRRGDRACPSASTVPRAP